VEIQGLDLLEYKRSWRVRDANSLRVKASDIPAVWRFHQEKWSNTRLPVSLERSVGFLT